jgi:hypothetical protein
MSASGRCANSLAILRSAGVVHSEEDVLAGVFEKSALDLCADGVGELVERLTHSFEVDHRTKLSSNPRSSGSSRSAGR